MSGGDTWSMGRGTNESGENLASRWAVALSAEPMQKAYEAQLEATEAQERVTGATEASVEDLADLKKKARLRDKLQAEVGGPVFLIPDFNLDYLKEKVAKLNKAATKLKCEPITIETTSAGLSKPDKDGSVYERLYVVVRGKAPRLAGWAFVATLEHDEGDTIIRRLPTFDKELDLSAYRDATPENCDHCHAKRRRNDTYLVQNEDGAIKQVGSNCLSDFLGHKNPQQYARFCESLADLLGEFASSEGHGSAVPRYERRLETKSSLAHVACMIRNNGWKSRGRAREDGGISTSELAEKNLLAQAQRTHERDGTPAWITPSQEDEELAEKAITWVRGLTEKEISAEGGNDYLYNLFTVINKDSVRARQMGIAASAIFAYQRAQERELKRKAREAGRVDAFVGDVGERRPFHFTVERVMTFEGDPQYGGGSYHKHILRDESGATLIWQSTRELEQSETYEGKYTVKAQEDTKYGKQTVITRPHGLVSAGEQDASDAAAS